MTSIAIVGPGAIGGTIAAWLAQHPAHQVSIAARTPFTTLHVEHPSGSLTAHPQVWTDPAQARRVEWVLVATKAYDSASAAQWLTALRDDATRVAVLQNGVEHVARFAPHVPAERIVPVMVDCPAERTAPGRIRQRGAIHMVVPQGAAGAAFVGLFAHSAIDVSETADFTTQVWRKLCLNSAGALSAILLKPAGIVQHDGVAAIMRQIIAECAAVARAEGAQLDDSVIDDVIAGMRRSPPDSINSLHADRVLGRPMEIDARNGVIVRLGRKHGIATPINEMVVALLEAAQG